MAALFPSVKEEEALVALVSALSYPAAGGASDRCRSALSLEACHGPSSDGIAVLPAVVARPFTDVYTVAAGGRTGGRPSNISDCSAVSWRSQCAKDRFCTLPGLPRGVGEITRAPISRGQAPQFKMSNDTATALEKASHGHTAEHTPSVALLSFGHQASPTDAARAGSLRFPSLPRIEPLECVDSRGQGFASSATKGPPSLIKSAAHTHAGASGKHSCDLLAREPTPAAAFPPALSRMGPPGYPATDSSDCLQPRPLAAGAGAPGLTAETPRRPWPPAPRDLIEVAATKRKPEPMAAGPQLQPFHSNTHAGSHLPTPSGGGSASSCSGGYLSETARWRAAAPGYPSGPTLVEDFETELRGCVQGTLETELQQLIKSYVQQQLQTMMPLWSAPLPACSRPPSPGCAPGAYPLSGEAPAPPPAAAPATQHAAAEPLGCAGESKPALPPVAVTAGHWLSSNAAQCANANLPAAYVTGPATAGETGLACLGGGQGATTPAAAAPPPSEPFPVTRVAAVDTCTVTGRSSPSLFLSSEVDSSSSSASPSWALRPSLPPVASSSPAPKSSDISPHSPGVPAGSSQLPDDDGACPRGGASVASSPCPATARGAASNSRSCALGSSLSVSSPSVDQGVGASAPTGEAGEDPLACMNVKDPVLRQVLHERLNGSPPVGETPSRRFAGLKLLVPYDVAGYLVGRRGSGIEAFQRRHGPGMKLQVSRQAEKFPGTSDRIVGLVGVLRNCLTALLEIVRVFCDRAMHRSADSHLEDGRPIPKPLVALKLVMTRAAAEAEDGPVRTHRRNIQNETGADIYITKSTDSFSRRVAAFNLQESLVQVSGRIEDVAKACCLLACLAPSESHSVELCKQMEYLPAPPPQGVAKAAQSTNASSSPSGATAPARSPSAAHLSATSAPVTLAATAPTSPAAPGVRTPPPGLPMPLAVNTPSPSWRCDKTSASSTPSCASRPATHGVDAVGSWRQAANYASLETLSALPAGDTRTASPAFSDEEVTTSPFSRTGSLQTPWPMAQQRRDAASVAFPAFSLPSAPRPPAVQRCHPAAIHAVYLHLNKMAQASLDSSQNPRTPMQASHLPGPPAPGLAKSATTLF
eukprot:GHVT01082854.1.p1 GENE.GHVT01082854.1~~GHVT01082854.1.p1  ORF type:complete len:1099 (+),score=268.93 GHVT01082854.1:879-4175(+)